MDNHRMEHFTPAQKKTVFFTVAGVLFFASVNQTIVGTALPKIIASLGGMQYFSWIFTVYMFTSSIAALIAGRLSDHYGRKKFFFFGIFTMMAASFACGLSTSMMELIAFRAVQGVGGGILISLAFAAVGDLFQVRERGKWQGLLASTFGLSSLIGPTLGGAIVDAFHWRWVFWMFLPLGFGAFFILRAYYPKDQKRETAFMWDVKGAFSLTTFVLSVLILLATQVQWLMWTSALAAPFLLAFFIHSELKAKDPLLPLRLFKKNNFTTANVAGFLLGVAMFGVIIYIPFYLQGVMALTGFHSGTMMMAMTLGLISSSALSGRAITYTGRYKIFAIMGIVFMVVGMLWMNFLRPDSNVVLVYLRLVLFGAGLGTCFTVSTFAVQLDVGAAHAGLAISASQLFRQIGGTIGVSLFGKIFASAFATKMGALALPAGIAAASALVKNPRALLDEHAIQKMAANVTPDMLAAFENFVHLCRETLGASLNVLYMYGGFLLLPAVIVMLFMHEYPLKETKSGIDSNLNTQEPSTIS